MRGPLNINAKRTSLTVGEEDGVQITAGPRDGHIALNVVIDMEQARLLFDLLGQIVNEDITEQHYQEWLAKQAFDAVGQLDQGGQVIPMHTMEDDLA